MNDVSLDRSLRHAALMAWRDEATLTAMIFMHDASRAAMGELENRLDEVSVMGAATDAAAIAHALVRPAMRDKVGEAAGAWFTEEARALRQIDDRLEPLALRFTDGDTRPGLPVDTASAAAGWTAPAWLRGPASAIGSALGRAAGEVSHRAVPEAARHLATDASAWVGRQVGEHSGAHERVRAAGRDELVRRWLGPAPDDSDPRPYLTQLLAIVDRTASDAREAIA